MNIIDDKIYLEVAELEGYGILKKTIYNGVALNKAGKSSKWVHSKPLGQKNLLIDFDFIPPSAQKKLPTKAALLETILEQKTKEAALLTAVKSIKTK